MQRLKTNYIAKFLEQHAAQEVIRFLRPRGRMEKYYNVSVLLFPIVSYFSQNILFYRAMMLLAILFFYLAAYIHPRMNKTKRLTYPNPAVHSWKFFIFWLLTMIILPHTPALNQIILPFLDLSYGEMEGWLTCSVVLLGTWINRVRLPLISINKWAWLSSVLKGYWYQSVVFLLLWISHVFPRKIGIFDLPPFLPDIVVFLGILSNFTSYVILQRSLNLIQLPKIAAIDPSIIFQRSFLIEIRDIGFATSVLILASILAWEPYYFRDLWLFLGLSFFVLGSMLLITAIPGTTNDASQLLLKETDKFQCILEPKEWEKITAISSILESFSENYGDLSTPNSIFIPKKSPNTNTLQLFDFNQHSLFTLPKLVFLLKETDHGALVVIIGEFQLQVTHDDNIKLEEASFEEMIIQPPDIALGHELFSQISIKDGKWNETGYLITILSWEEWNRLKQHLTKFTPRKKRFFNDMINLVNVESWEELRRHIIENALLFTRWAGPMELFRLSDEPVTTKETLRTQLPGFHLVKTPYFVLMNVLGIVKTLIISNGISYYQVPTITIVDRPKDYFFIDTPIFSLLDTDRGEASKIFGFNMKSGILSALNEDDLTSLICRSSNEAESFLMGLKKIISGKNLRLFFFQQTNGIRYAMMLSSTGVITELFRPHYFIRESRILKHFSKSGRENTKKSISENKKPLKDGKIDLEAAQLLLLHVPQCAICNRPIRKSSVICPFCGEEFCREEWFYYVHENERCPICQNKIKLPEKYRKILGEND